MLRIRSEQMAVLRDYMRNQFEERLVAHVQKHFPVKCQELGDERLRDGIQKSIQRAKKHRLESERDIAKYIHLIFAADLAFDEDPSLRELDV